MKIKFYNDFSYQVIISKIKLMKLDILMHYLAKNKDET